MMEEIKDIEHATKIELYHPELPYYVHIDIFRYQGARRVVTYWGSLPVFTHEWIRITVIAPDEPLYDRTTWTPGTEPALFVTRMFEIPLHKLENKLFAYQGMGYEITEVHYEQ